MSEVRIARDAIGAIIELRAERQRLRREVDALPSHRDCDHMEDEKRRPIDDERDRIERKLSRIDDDITEQLSVGLIAALVALAPASLSGVGDRKDER